MMKRVGIFVPRRVLIAIEGVFEGAVVFSNQRIDIIAVVVPRHEPPFRVVSAQRPAHDLEAFFYYFCVRQDDYRHGTLRRNRDHLGRLVAQDHLAQCACLAGGRNRQARPHGIGTPPKGIQNGKIIRHAAYLNRQNLLIS